MFDCFLVSRILSILSILATLPAKPPLLLRLKPTQKATQGLSHRFESEIDFVALDFVANQIVHTLTKFNHGSCIQLVLQCHDSDCPKGFSNSKLQASLRVCCVANLKLQGELEASHTPSSSQIIDCQLHVRKKSWTNGMVSIQYLGHGDLLREEKVVAGFGFWRFHA